MLIAPRWYAATDTEGRRRLDNPKDSVRIEAEAALARGITVVPVLLDGAVLPPAADLPPSLRPLTGCRALELNRSDSGRDFARLVAEVEGVTRSGLNRRLRRVSYGAGIFLSYRRQDTAAYARLLQSEFSARIPNARVFIDMDSIEAGSDFAEVIREALDSCRVLVALIGPQWATLVDDEGRRRLDDPDDYVRLEIRTALERDVRVIPVLVDNAQPPRRRQLPSDLQKLFRLNALKMSYDRYHYDADRLLDVIQQVLAEAPRH